MKTYLLLGLALLSAHLSFAQNIRSSSEVFIQIEDRGHFTVYLDEEFVGSSTGRFRFYDVSNYSPMLSILQGNKKIYSNKISVQDNERLIINFSMRRGLKLVKTLAIYNNGQYALDDFDNDIDRYQNVITQPVRPSRNLIDEFETLSNLVKREAFDDNKIKVIQAYTVHSRVSTAQVALLMKNFSNDDKKLFLVKSLASTISDPQNFYTLKESFTFLSTKDEFLKYLNGQQIPRVGQNMRNSTYEQLLLSVKKEAFDDNRTKVIQAAIQHASPSTAQMYALLKLYTFEDKALDCAKMAYSFVNDKQRYFTIKDVFKFMSTKDAFLAYLGQ